LTQTQCSTSVRFKHRSVLFKKEKNLLIIKNYGNQKSKISEFFMKKELVFEKGGKSVEFDKNKSISKENRIRMLKVKHTEKGLRDHLLELQLPNLIKT
jgi:hypothetical protein